MNDHDTVRNVTSHGTHHGTQQGVTVHEAAVTLGLSPEAVRARLRRGTLDGWKADDDTWRVRLPDTGRGANSQHEELAPGSGSTSPGSEVETPVTDVTPPLRDGTKHGTKRDVPDVTLVTHLQAEVTYLRERLEDAMGQLADERRRADVLRLGASVSAPDEPQVQTYRAAAQTPPTGILARLKRWLTGNN